MGWNSHSFNRSKKDINSYNVVFRQYFVIFSTYVMAPMDFQEVAADDDDDLDLFGDETEEDKKAAEAREQAKASTKKKESEFSLKLVWLFS